MHTASTPRPPTPFQIASARQIVTNPEQFHDKPAMRALSWETLKRARGQTVDQTRIGTMQEAFRAAHLRLVINAAIATMATRRRPAFHDDVQPDFNGAA